MSLYRRGALSIATSLFAGGCLGGANTPTENCSSQVVVGVEQFDPITSLSGSFSEHERAVVAETAAGEEPRVTTYREGPFPERTLVTHDESFHRIRRRLVDETTVPTFEMTVSSTDEATPGGEPLSFSALPETDRQALRVAVLGPWQESLPQDLSVDGFPAPYPDGASGSQLAGGVSWVRWQERTLQVEVAGEGTGELERATYAYEAERVADDPEAFRSFLDESYLIDIGGFPEPQRQFVASVTETGSRNECHPQPDVLAALRDRLDDRKELPAPYGETHRRNWYVDVSGEKRLLSIYEGV